MKTSNPKDAEFMPGGRYFDSLYLKKATCLGIALLVNGDVVAI